MKKLLKKILSHSFLMGIASVFYPSVIQVDYIEMPSESDSANLANDWKQVGSYINKAYESVAK